MNDATSAPNQSGRLGRGALALALAWAAAVVLAYLAVREFGLLL